MTAIAADRLEKKFGDVTALEGLSFSVGSNEMYGLIGPDGAGKTTFMRIAACLLIQDGGMLEIGGHDTRKHHRKIQNMIGYMPQRFSLYQDLSVGENLAFFADLFGVPKRERDGRIDELLRFSRLGDFLERRAGNLSGGMKQKLALSCTLIHTPDILFLDEPTTGVDPVSRREFWNLLKSIRDDGATIIVSTPYMDEAEKCDRVGFILGGSLIAEGTPEELPGQFEHTVLAVRGEKIVWKTRKREFPDSVIDVRTFGDRLHLTVDDAERAKVEVREFLRGLSVENIDIREVRPSMEDVFVEHMRYD